jgi:hypothetical protein
MNYDPSKEHLTEWGQVCGRRYVGDGIAFCERHQAENERRYPWGWRFYPGDVCSHGYYVGGVGIDWLCPRCEDGEE